MARLKQRANESDADFAARLERDKEAQRESKRKWREANKEAQRESKRKWREANKEAQRGYERKYREANREACRESSRKWYEAKVLSEAKGRPLRSDFSRPKRPAMLTRLILKVAEEFCRDYGFPLESRLDCDVLRHAAETIRNSPELDGAANPWYGSDYLHKSTTETRSWATNFRRTWRNKV